MFSALFDANVLFPRYLRDSVLELGISNFYKPLWSQTIFDETEGALARRSPHYGPAFRRQAEAMTRMFPESNVGNFEHLLSQLTEVDPKDAHVLAAAIAGSAGAIVTFNLKHFPKTLFESHGIELKHPDDFLLDQVDLEPLRAFSALARQIADYDQPFIRAIELASKIAQNKCPGFANFIAINAQDIDHVADSIISARIENV